MGISLPFRALWLVQPAFIPGGRAVVLIRERGEELLGQDILGIRASSPYKVYP
jgi:hypothetical protein